MHINKAMESSIRESSEVMQRLLRQLANRYGDFSISVDGNGRVLVGCKEHGYLASTSLHSSLMECLVREGETPVDQLAPSYIGGYMGRSNDLKVLVLEHEDGKYGFYTSVNGVVSHTLEPTEDLNKLLKIGNEMLGEHKKLSA